MTPLPLDSPRWRQLKAHFGNAGQDADLPSVPTLIARWHHAVGTYGEEYAYADLRESYLHQRTILDVAYAVVPHLASRLRELDPDRCIELFEDLDVVESVRLKSREEVEVQVAEVERAFPEDMREMMVQSTRDRLAPLPPDLASSYVAAIQRVEALGGARWREDLADADHEAPHPRHWRRHVKYLRDSGWTDADIAFGFHALRATEPDEIVELVYKSLGEAHEALCRLEKVPLGWFERTRLHIPDGVLGFRALHTLASWAALTVTMILAT